MKAAIWLFMLALLVGCDTAPDTAPDPANVALCEDLCQQTTGHGALYIHGEEFGDCDECVCGHSYGERFGLCGEWEALSQLKSTDSVCWDEPAWVERLAKAFPEGARLAAAEQDADTGERSCWLLKMGVPEGGVVEIFDPDGLISPVRVERAERLELRVDCDDVEFDEPLDQPWAVGGAVSEIRIEPAREPLAIEWPWGAELEE